jgi:hypothetical protein
LKLITAWVHYYCKTAVQVVRIEKRVHKIGTGVIHNVAHKICGLLNLLKHWNNAMQIIECLNKHRKDKQLNNKHRLNIYKEEETPPGPPRAAIYPIFR